MDIWISHLYICITNAASIKAMRNAVFVEARLVEAAVCRKIFAVPNNSNNKLKLVLNCNEIKIFEY